MELKSLFFNGYIIEEVYIEQPPGFENLKTLTKYINLMKHLLLRQAPNASYGRLTFSSRT